MSKYAPIDILKLYSGQIEGLRNTTEWNNYLTQCFISRNVKALIDLRYRLQCGMAELEKNKMANDSIREKYFRWIGSLEKTVRKINKSVNASPNDLNKHKESNKKTLQEKRRRDAMLEEFLRKNSY